MSRRLGMFERLRGKPREWLLLRPPATPGSAWQWLHYVAHQAPSSGDWPPPAHCLELPGVLIIPALDCSHFCLPAPPGLKRQEWPQLLEEYVQQPAEQLWVSCLSRECGHLELLVMQRQQVQQWLADCAALGVQITQGWAELQLLPTPEPGQTLRWQREQLLCLKSGDKTQPKRWLVWPQVLGETLPLSWRELPGEQLQGSWPSRLAALAQLPNVLEGARPPQVRVRRNEWLSRVQQRLLLGCGLLAACWGAVYLVQTWQALETWKAEVKTLVGPASTLNQARAALNRLQQRESDWRLRQQQVVTLEQALGAWLAQQPGRSVSSQQFDGRVWRLGLSGAGPQPALAAWQAMAQAAGAEVRLDPPVGANEVRLSFDLEAGP